MSAYVIVTPSSTDASSEWLMSLARFQLPSQASSAPGLCVFPQLTATTKTILEALLPLCVGLAMLAMYKCGRKILPRWGLSSGSMGRPPVLVHTQADSGEASRTGERTPLLVNVGVAVNSSPLDSESLEVAPMDQCIPAALPVSTRASSAVINLALTMCVEFEKQ